MNKSSNSIHPEPNIDHEVLIEYFKFTISSINNIMINNKIITNIEELLQLYNDFKRKFLNIYNYIPIKRYRNKKYYLIETYNQLLDAEITEHKNMYNNFIYKLKEKHKYTISKNNHFCISENNINDEIINDVNFLNNLINNDSKIKNDNFDKLTDSKTNNINFKSDLNFTDKFENDSTKIDNTIDYDDNISEIYNNNKQPENHNIINIKKASELFMTNNNNINNDKSYQRKNIYILNFDSELIFEAFKIKIKNSGYKFKEFFCVKKIYNDNSYILLCYIHFKDRLSKENLKLNISNDICKNDFIINAKNKKDTVKKFGYLYYDYFNEKFNS